MKLIATETALLERIATLEVENKRLHNLNLMVTKKAWETEAARAALEAQVAALRTELAAAQAKVTALREVVEAVEWVNVFAGTDMGGEEECPWCEKLYIKGHAANCPRQAALGLAKGGE